MSFHVPNQYRLRRGDVRHAPHLESDESYGNNGMFVIPACAAARRPLALTVQASDGVGWDHCGYPPPSVGAR